MHLPPSFLLPCLQLPLAGVRASVRKASTIAYWPHAASSVRTYAQAAVRDDFAEPQQTQRQSTGETPSPPRHPQAGEYPFPKKPNPTPYEIMHLERTATGAEIKKRYYSLALLYHPDSTHPSSSSENFTTLNKAYKLLSNDHARSLYNRASVGWSAGPDSLANSSRRGGGADPWNDEMMRAEIRRRQGAHHWGSPNYGPAAGRGSSHYAHARWGHGGAASGFGAYGMGMGEQEMTGGKPIYTSNSRFVGAVFVLSVLFGFVQYNRALAATETAREVVERRHMNASQALAEARQEARLYGHQRREQIKRIVRAQEVDREYDRLSTGEGGRDGDELDVDGVGIEGRTSGVA